MRVIVGGLGLPSPKHVLLEVMPIVLLAFLLLVLEDRVSSCVLTCKVSGTSLFISLAVVIRCL